ncbi:zinc finger protein with KRAB and SCAN domains 8-like isoform X2 [Electrophorus electricus]|uniref:zinc finger protein with KRAB and SCAN domains 8-like isoform X2 n=1 Tax=Electrophorus electricus TaxID=8005 RepID=UPI0015CFF906|nr:zinc finger protein with KRAB and SCAN domains 8-like isoform X2 [Electrophorus electricus]
MTKMEYLNSFFVNRLMAAAGEIFDAVKDAVSGYQQEVERTKQENRRLMRMLAEMKAVSMETSPADVHASDADGVVSENQNFNQGPLVSDPSLIQLELATMKQEADTQLNEVPTRISPCAKSAHDAQTSHPEGPALGQQNSDYEPHDTSLIRVKLELSTLEPDDDEEAELLPEAPTRLNPSPKKIDAEKVTRTFPAITKDNEGLQMNSYLTINLVPCDAQRTPDNLNSNAMKNESRSGGCERGTKEGTEDHYCPYCKESFKESSLLASHLVIHEGVPIPFYCQICGRHFKNRVTLKNHMIVHQKLRRFRCHFCGKGFHQKGHLKEHERIHTGEKPYGCSICGKRFTQFNHVRVHVRNHHQDISEPLEKPQNKR